MPCGFTGEVEPVTSDADVMQCNSTEMSVTGWLLVASARRETGGVIIMLVLKQNTLSPSRPPNNTLNTQSRAQQTHSRSRSLRAHPRRADPLSVMPRVARLGCR
eukprot:scaffold69624_cov58-Phaeocystis_antarctica.AAC.1